MNSRNILLSLVIFFSLYIFPTAAYAFTVRSSDSVIVPSRDTILGSFVAGGTNIKIDGTVTGDVICAGRTVEITGIVGGDVLCLAQEITVTGNVAGNIRSAAQSLFLNGSVGKNITVAGQDIQNKADIGGEMAAVGQSISVGGSVTGDVSSAGEMIAMSGSVGGSLYAMAGRLEIRDGANIRGNIEYASDKEAIRTTGATISGQITRREPEKRSRAEDNVATRKSISNPWSGRLASLVLAFVTGLALFALAKERTVRTMTSIMTKPWSAVGTGFVILFIAPAVIVVLAITILGIPLAVLAGLALAVGIFVGRVIIGLVFGRLITNRYFLRYADDPVAISGIGTMVVYLFLWVPIAGWVFGFFTILWGLGGVYILIRQPQLK